MPRWFFSNTSFLTMSDEAIVILKEGRNRQIRRMLTKVGNGD